MIYCYILHLGKVITAGQGATRHAAAEAAILALPSEHDEVLFCETVARFFRVVV